jgi:hypothetical protein
MKKSQYTFGYLFVRFSKLLAALTVLAGVGSAVYLWLDYMARAENTAYRVTGSMRLHCNQLQDELDFAKKEVARLGTVEDLSPLKFSSECATGSEFSVLLEQLKAAGDRDAILKDRLMSGFASRIETLRGIIKATIASIEASRAANRVQTAPIAMNNPVSPPTTTSTPQPALTGQRTVFDSIGARELEDMTTTINGVGDFLDKLESNAEREENRMRIKDARISLNGIIAWLPRKNIASPPPPTPSQVFQPTPTSVVTAPPHDPLVEAQKNYDNLGDAFETVRQEVTRDWRLDRVLIETMHAAEEESAKCRAAEGQIKVLRIGFFGQAGATLGASLAVAFLILVFADLLQSFFDTASNSAAGVELLENKWK